MNTRNKIMPLAILFAVALVAATGIRWFCSNCRLVEEPACGIAASDSRPNVTPEAPVSSGKPAETKSGVPSGIETQRNENADFYLTYESVIPPNAVTLHDWSFLTNSLSLVAAEAGGFVTHKKDSFSKLVTHYEAPENGYAHVINYEMRRTHDKIFLNERLDESEYLFFKTRVRRKPEDDEEACYGKIYELVFSEHYAETNKAKIKMAYYFNPTPNDRNLEFDGKNNLFKPDWRDTSWPREP